VRGFVGTRALGITAAGIGKGNPLKRKRTTGRSGSTCRWNILENAFLRRQETGKDGHSL
jgi:hypothetical protein